MAKGNVSPSVFVDRTVVTPEWCTDVSSTVNGTFDGSSTFAKIQIDGTGNNTSTVGSGNLAVSGSATIGTGLTVSAGGAAITGNLSAGNITGAEVISQETLGVLSGPTSGHVYTDMQCAILGWGWATPPTSGTGAVSMRLARGACTAVRNSTGNYTFTLGVTPSGGGLHYMVTGNPYWQSGVDTTGTAASVSFVYVSATTFIAQVISAGSPADLNFSFLVMGIL